MKGRYTLANNSMVREVIPNEFQKKLPNSYKSIPTTLLSRLAVDNRFQKQGTGRILLIDALKKSCENSNIIHLFAVVVDLIDEDAERFYSKH